MRTRATAVVALLATAMMAALAGMTACKPKTTGDAEANHDIAWLSDEASPQAMAALGRLADSDRRRSGRWRSARRST